MDATLIDNFKFRQFLEVSTLTFAEKYDINTIFNCLSNERKVHIIDNWPIYLDQILKIKNETLEKRKENIAETLDRISNIVDEAILRKMKQEEEKKQLEIELKEVQKNAIIFDQMKKLSDLKKLINNN